MMLYSSNLSFPLYNLILVSIGPDMKHEKGTFKFIVIYSVILALII